MHASWPKDNGNGWYSREFFIFSNILLSVKLCTCLCSSINEYEDSCICLNEVFLYFKTSFNQHNYCQFTPIIEIYCWWQRDFTNSFSKKLKEKIKGNKFWEFLSVPILGEINQLYMAVGCVAAYSMSKIPNSVTGSLNTKMNTSYNCNQQRNKIRCKFSYKNNSLH